jgi:S-adenosylmethionine uptake transporter
MQAIWMLAASFFFAAMSACIKFAAPHFDLMELVGYRGAIGIVFMAVLARARGVPLQTQVPTMHLWRNVIGVAAMVAWFYAIANLPLATAITLESMSSVWIAVFMVAGTVLMRRAGMLQGQGPLLTAVIVGFVGVILVLGPTLGGDELFAGLIGLSGGMMAALAYMDIAALGRVGEPDTRTVFYYSIGCLLAGLAWIAIFGGHTLLQPAALWLIPMGVLGGMGQLCMTRAFTHGATIVVANLQYSGIIFGAILGFVFFGDRIPTIGWLGIALIAASGMFATALRTRAAAPSQTHKEHAPCIPTSSRSIS